MKKQLLLFLLPVLFISNGYSAVQQDQTQKLKEEISSLKNDIAKIERDQLNYKIEKDLIRETYSTNYESFNMVITLILGIVGILGYIGIRDISSIKKEYKEELNSLKEIQYEFKAKAKEFDSEKRKFDNEIKEILQQNELQNRKIKFIELKEKIGTLIQNNKIYEALEFTNAALELEPNDVFVLRYKGRALCRLNQVEDALKVYRKLLEIDPENKINILDSIEMMYLANEVEEAKNLISKNEKLFFDKEEGGLAKFLNLVKLYHEDKIEELLQEVKKIIDFENFEIAKRKYKTWSLEEAKFYIAHQESSEKQKILQNAIWYLEGQINGKVLCDRIGIEVEQEKEV